MADCRIHHGATIENQKLVSIIIPVFNTEKYLDECMQSIICQSYKNIEILLINDGSTDDSNEKCLNWNIKDPRIRYFEREHSGLGATRNFGIERARGEYVMFLDSDDWVSPYFVEHMQQAITANDADMAFCDYYKMDGQRTFPFLTKAYTEHIITSEARGTLIYGADVAMWIKIYKKELFIENDILIPDGPYEDTATYPLIVSSCEKIVHLKEKLLYYRINRKGSILSFQGNRKFAINALEHVCIQMKKRELFFQYKNELERFCARFISYSLREMESAEFKQDREKLVTFFYDTFPEAEKPYGKQFLSVGSNNLYCIINQIPYDLRRTVKTTLKEMPKKYVPGTFDYIAIDFQEDHMKQDMPDKAKIQKTAKFLGQTDVLEIFLVKSRFASTYGEYSGINTFEQHGEINQANEIIERKEALFLKAMNAMKKNVSIISNTDKHLLFADISSRHGCMPYHLNDAYYLKMADCMIRHIREENSI